MLPKLELTMQSWRTKSLKPFFHFCNLNTMEQIIHGSYLREHHGLRGAMADCRLTAALLVPLMMAAAAVTRRKGTNLSAHNVFGIKSLHD